MVARNSELYLCKRRSLTVVVPAAGAEEKLLIRWRKKMREQAERDRETSRLGTSVFYNFPADHVNIPNTELKRVTSIKQLSSL